MAQYNQVTKLRRIEEAIKRMDPNLDMGSDTFKAALILVVSAYIGANIRRVAKFTGYPYRLVNEVGNNLRKGGIWVGSRVAASEWFDSEVGGTAFWMHVLVGEGKLNRVYTEDGVVAAKIQQEDR